MVLYFSKSLFALTGQVTMGRYSDKVTRGCPDSRALFIERAYPKSHRPFVPPNCYTISLYAVYFLFLRWLSYCACRFSIMVAGLHVPYSGDFNLDGGSGCCYLPSLKSSL